jgi:hypothetical protein
MKPRAEIIPALKRIFNCGSYGLERADQRVRTGSMTDLSSSMTSQVIRGMVMEPCMVAAVPLRCRITAQLREQAACEVAGRTVTWGKPPRPG